MLAFLAIQVAMAGGDADGWAYRDGQPDSRVLQTPRTLSRAAFRDADVGLAPLVEWLTEDTDDPLLRARRIHDWIALNVSYDVVGWQSHPIPSQTPASVLRRRMAVCAGYSGLFTTMASMAGLETANVGGRARSWGYDVFADPWTDHSWNAVRANESWYLLDVTWDAGSVDSGQRFHRQYATDYLFLSPELFVLTHLPDDPTDEHLAVPLAEPSVAALPYLRGRFEDDLREQVPLKRTTDAQSDAWVRFMVRPGVALGAELLSATGEPMRGCVNVWVDRGIGTVHAIFPEPGSFEMVLFTRRQGEESGREVGRLGFNASEATASDIRYSTSAIMFGADEGDDRDEDDDEDDGSKGEPESVTP